MKKFSILLLILSVNSLAITLRGGDLILQPLKCDACEVISDQTKSLYSHIGIVILKKGHPFVAQALDKVKLSPLAAFLSQGFGEHLVIRSHQKIDNQKLLQDFTQKYDGLPYDDNFRWDERALYCSELVYLLLHLQKVSLPPLQPMKFDVNREYWIRYFHGNPPDGELGNSPSDFEESKLFNVVGTL